MRTLSVRIVGANGVISSAVERLSDLPNAIVQQEVFTPEAQYLIIAELQEVPDYVEEKIEEEKTHANTSPLAYGENPWRIERTPDRAVDA